MYSLTIVGGGEISCGYDNPKSKSILTHINGAIKHPGIQLNSIVEINRDKHDYIKDKWGKRIKIFSDLNESLSNFKSDIFVIATPTNTHLRVIKNILFNYCPKLILCEKPIVSKIKEYEELYKLLESYNTKIMTNFPRRFDISLNILKKEILNSKKKYHFYGTFNKGLIHNGSHMIDLISMLVGPIRKIDFINFKTIKNDFFGRFLVKTDNCNGIISNIDSKDLSVFEFVLYTNHGKFEIIGANNKINIYYLDNLNHFKGFKAYLDKKKLPHTLESSAYNTYDYAIELIKNTAKYKKFMLEQKNINHIIFKTQKKFFKLNSRR